MTKEESAVLQLVKVASGASICFDASSQLDYDKILDIACRQGVACLCLDALELLCKNGGKGNIAQEFILQLYARKMNTVKAMQEKRNVIAEFAEKMLPLHGFVLKGLDYSQFWPNSLYREYGDFDCFYAGKYEEVNKRAAEIGAKVEYSTHKHSHIYYKGVMVENHRTLTNYDGSKIGRKTETALLDLLNEDHASLLEGTCLLSPNPTFTACFMLKHAQQHFMTEGIELRHFLDWMFFVEKTGDDIDWKRLEGLLDEMRLRNFADMMTAYCVTRLGWKPKGGFGADFDTDILRRVDELVFSSKADVHDKRPIYRATRIFKRFVRAWHFRHLHYLPYHQAIWTWIAYASTLDRKPKDILAFICYI